MEAAANASSVVGALRNLRWHAKRRFPRRKDLVKVLNEALRTLREPTGTMFPEEVLWKWMFDWVSSDFELPHRELVEKWKDTPGIEWEFRGLPLSRCDPGKVMSEEQFSEVASFLRQWIRDQRVP